MSVRLVSLWNWFEIAAVITVWTVLVTLSYLLTTPFDRVRRLTGYLFRKGGHLMIWLNPLWKVELLGDLGPGKREACVVIANHQSLADIPVVSHVPWEMKWLSKRSNFGLPGMGWMMRMVGDIPLDRGDRDSASVAMARCRWYLDRGMSVMIFPEGTRSHDGKLLPFKDGAFRLAIESGRPILPIVVVGTHDCIPKSSWKFKGRARMKVQVLAPIEVKGLTLQDTERLKAQVQHLMSTVFERLNRTQETPLPVTTEPHPAA